MTTVLGVDGARGGWIGALMQEPTRRNPRQLRLQWLNLPSAEDVVGVAAEVIGIDIPIGLPEGGWRACDLAAKRLLGRSSARVFLTPPRPVLSAADYATARRICRDSIGKGLSAQTWGIVPKIREVDAVASDPRLVEVHPELSFTALHGAVLPSKKSAEGRADRIAALRGWLPELAVTGLPPGDDALDALACAWTALRWARGEATVLPPGPTPYDALGRPMRIVS